MARLSSFLPLAAMASRALASGSFKTSLEVTYGNGSPDGFQRPMFMINGTSPGPVLRWDDGDDVEITVINSSPENITMHWHGLDQEGTPWSDGVPGVTQLPIEPGHDYVYRFKAVQSGSYWYHSHLRSQLQDGCMGAISVRQRPGAPNPFHLIDDDCDAIQEMTEAARNPKSLLITDWYHFLADDIQAMSEAAQFEVGCVASFLFNGKGRITCPSAEELAANASPDMQAALGLVADKNLTLTDMGCVPPEALEALFVGVFPPGTFSPGKLGALDPALFSGCKATDTPLEVIQVGLNDWTAIELASGLGYESPIFSIDEHELYVYAVDGAQINPQKVTALTPGNGDRHSFFIYPDTPGEYAIRLIQQAPFQLLQGVAILQVLPSRSSGDSCDDGNGNGNGSGGGQSSSPAPISNTDIPTSNASFSLGGVPQSEDIVFYNFTLGTPFPAIPLPQDVYALHRLEMINVNGINYWSLNGSAENMAALEGSNPPVLYTPPTDNFEPGNSFSTLNGTTHDVLFITSLGVPHMLHKHSRHFRVLGSGTGNFTWNSVEEAAKAMPEAFNLENPPKRDTIFTIAALDAANPGWMVIRFTSDNPGPFVMHCHIRPHMNGGMLMVVEEGVDEWPPIPAEYAL